MSLRLRHVPSNVYYHMNDTTRLAIHTARSSRRSHHTRSTPRNSCRPTLSITPLPGWLTGGRWFGYWLCDRLSDSPLLYHRVVVPNYGMVEQLRHESEQAPYCGCR
jgi:hypothetical protein